ncbi:hypothetical protein EGW08_007260 [Elysia chlorotica]|uniref:Homeobox domain-containing protein n=1 Tax=Elysia chlorotica TaxID=188477 RepID=A0A3S0ZSV1_ELYCH|nr:hypothetical protein EGW08_007260 [Elysia chlorotica]
MGLTAFTRFRLTVSEELTITENQTLLNALPGADRTFPSPGADRTFPSVPHSDTQTCSSRSQPESSHVTGLRRPELTFSIERILGLGTHSALSRPEVSAAGPGRAVFATVSALCPARPAAFMRHHDRNDEDDVDDDDIDDDDDDDDGDSVIDVGGPGDGSQFLSRPDYDFSGDAACLTRDGVPNYQWLHCTRYHPPKLQRSKKAAGSKKRKLGRNPRVPFTQHQVLVLEEKFRRTHYLSSMDVAELSTALSLTETRTSLAVTMVWQSDATMYKLNRARFTVGGL